MRRSALSLAVLEQRWPWIEWREPLLVHQLNNVDAHWACRICIALRGLKGKEIPSLPRDPELVRAHIRKEHLHASPSPSTSAARSD